MPLYEFKCKGCGETWEVKQAWKDPYPPCPACASEDVGKVYHAAALIFKGSGWHVNDYANGNGSAKNGSEKAETSSAPSTTENTSTAKDTPAASSNGSGGDSAKPASAKSD